MAFSRKKPRRNMSITSSEFEYVHRTSPECGGGDMEGGGCEDVGREDSVGGEMVDSNSTEFEVLREGYLNMSVRAEEEEVDRSGTIARTLRSLKSTGSFSRSWKKRWCVLCRTRDGISIFYYNKKSSYTNLDVPVGILFMDESRKIFTLPSHPKSRSVFAIDFPYRTVHLYPEKEHQLTEWLDVLKTSLRLTEHTPSPSRSPSSSSSSTTLPPTSRSLSPLLSKRSAPKRKSLKRGSSFRTGRIEEEEGVVLARAIVTTGSSDKPVSGAAPGNIDHLSFSTLTS